LDLGTGPFAVLSIIAAQHGAGKVYAIEANPQVAQSARETIAKLGYQTVITVLEGFSSTLELPNSAEKADFVMAEIIGSIATEEGAYATIRDAHARLVKEPTKSSSWIPCRIQTYAAPASYTLHTLLQPPAFDWTKLHGEPVRFNCRDEGLQLLSDPILVEDISFADIIIDDGRTKGTTNGKKSGNTLLLLGQTQVVFPVDGDRLQDNTMAFYDEPKQGRMGTIEAEQVAAATGSSFTGIALWPRLILNDDDSDNDNNNTDDATTTTSFTQKRLVVDSRSYPEGGHQRSHWQTVLPIMCPTPVTGLKGGDKIAVTFAFEVSDNVLQPPRYTIEGDVIRV
jgi:Ribosomal protein L11 methyltransferase (PrmA)